MSDMVAEKKEEFVQTFRRYINRDGSEALLAWLEKTDFFQAPASTKYHLNYPGGLCEHSLNVFHRLRDFMANEYGMNECPYDNESIALVSLCHDLCKIGLYSECWKNQKTYDAEKVAAASRYSVKHDAAGDFIWETVLGYEIDEQFIFGHGEKSVYLVREFMRLTPEEAQAIRFHMGSWNRDEARNAGDVFAQNPLAFYLHVADEAATFIDEVEA